MTEVIDELGPVDWLVVEFPGSRFNGEIAPTITDLVDREIIRVLDFGRRCCTRRGPSSRPARGSPR
jgi:hypothetical protein